VDTIGTDHAPHPREAKERPYTQAPSGMPGLEAALPLLLTAMLQGALSFRRLLEITSEGAARAFGIAHSDWVLVDMEQECALAEGKILSRCGWSPYVGRPLRGWPRRVWVNGRLALDRGIFPERGPGKEVAFRPAGGW